MQLTTKRESQEIYRRELPGGGFVAIEVQAIRNFIGQRRYRGTVIVERRSAARREGHRAPVIASTVATTTASLVHSLFPITQSNVRVATECLALAQQRLRPRAFGAGDVGDGLTGEGPRDRRQAR